MIHKCNALILFGSLMVVAHTGHAQPPPTSIGNGADTPRGVPGEFRPGQPRGMDAREGRARGERPTDEAELRQLRRTTEPVHRDRQGREHERFRWEERETIRRWYSEGDRRAVPGVAAGRRDLPPGLQRRLDRGDDLPPGWRRKVERGELLEQDQVRHGRRIDEELRRRLPRQPDGTVLLETEDQVIRVLETTGEVLDVFGIGR